MVTWKYKNRFVWNAGEENVTAAAAAATKEHQTCEICLGHRQKHRFRSSQSLSIPYVHVWRSGKGGWVVSVSFDVRVNPNGKTRDNKPRICFRRKEQPPAMYLSPRRFLSLHCCLFITGVVSFSGYDCIALISVVFCWFQTCHLV